MTNVTVGSLVTCYDLGFAQGEQVTIVAADSLLPCYESGFPTTEK